MRIDASDVGLFLGAVCVVAGVGQMHVPAAWIVVGLLIIGYGVAEGFVGARKAEK